VISVEKTVGEVVGGPFRGIVFDVVSRAAFSGKGDKKDPLSWY
jgi:hypothetical protein